VESGIIVDFDLENTSDSWTAGNEKKPGLDEAGQMQAGRGSRREWG
jgi:hypothetical protein